MSAPDSMRLTAARAGRAQWEWGGAPLESPGRSRRLRRLVAERCGSSWDWARVLLGEGPPASDVAMVGARRDEVDESAPVLPAGAASANARQGGL